MKIQKVVLELTHAEIESLVSLMDSIDIYHKELNLGENTSRMVFKEKIQSLFGGRTRCTTYFGEKDTLDNKYE